MGDTMNETNRDRCMAYRDSESGLIPCVKKARWVVEPMPDGCHQDAEPRLSCNQHLYYFMHRGMDCTGSWVHLL